MQISMNYMHMYVSYLPTFYLLLCVMPCVLWSGGESVKFALLIFHG